MQGTTTGDKNEILWQHNVNYQTLPEQFKKASGYAAMYAQTLRHNVVSPFLHMQYASYVQPSKVAECMMKIVTEWA